MSRPAAESITYPVDQRPVPRLGQERKLLQHAAQQPVLEDERVGRHDHPPVPEQLQLAPPQRRLLEGRERWRRARAPAVGRGAPPRRLDVVALLVAPVGLPAQPARPEVVVPVAVEEGAAEEEGDDDERLEERADRHGVGWLEMITRARYVFVCVA